MAAKNSLNPFDFRAWVSRTTCVARRLRNWVLIPLISGLGFHDESKYFRVRFAVLIPLISGLGFHHENPIHFHHAAAVLIPLISGLGFHGKLERGSRSARSLNPFDFRAWVSHRSRIRPLWSVRLNPFDFRAWVSPLPMTKLGMVRGS